MLSSHKHLLWRSCEDSVAWDGNLRPLADQEVNKSTIMETAMMWAFSIGANPCYVLFLSSTLLCLFLFSYHLYTLPTPFLKTSFSFEPQNTCCSNLRKCRDSEKTTVRVTPSVHLYRRHSGKQKLWHWDCPFLLNRIISMILFTQEFNSSWANTVDEGHLPCHRDRINYFWREVKRHFLNQFCYHRKCWSNYALKGNILMQ